jgi:hypothetical protein
MAEPRWKEALFALPPEALELEVARLDRIIDELTDLRDEAQRRLQEQRRVRLPLVVGGRRDAQRSSALPTCCRRQ